MGRGIGRPEGRILEAVNLFGQLTAEQLSRHLDYSFRYTQDRCKDLAAGKYLQRLTLPKRTQAGSVPYVYTLARKGRRHLTDEGIAVKIRYRPSEQQARLHTLATNEVLLQVIQATEKDPSLTLVRFIQDREFQNEPIQVPIPDKSRSGTASLIPDLWLHIRQSGEKTYSYYFCIEVNLTPVEQKRWRRKVAMYLYCAKGIKERVGVDVFQVVTFLASPVTVLRRGTGSYSAQEHEDRAKAMAEAEKRKNDYLEWTERELAAHKREDDADWFVYSSLPFDSLTPSELVFSEHFSMPTGTETISLIPAE
jgi:Replication-relaxation